MYGRNESPDYAEVDDEEHSGDDFAHDDHGDAGGPVDRSSRQFIASPLSSSGMSSSSRFGSTGSLSQSPFPLHSSLHLRDAYSEDHVVWRGTAVLVKIGCSQFSSVKCSSEPMMCHISSQFIWFIRSASRPSSGLPVDIFTFRDVSSTLALQTFEFYDSTLKRCNYILLPNRDEYCPSPRPLIFCNIMSDTSPLPTRCKRWASAYRTSPSVHGCTSRTPVALGSCAGRRLTATANCTTGAASPTICRYRPLEP